MARTASPPWTTWAAGIHSPGSKRVVATGFQSMKPVAIITTVPQMSDQYSTFSSHVKRSVRGRSFAKPRL